MRGILNFLCGAAITLLTSKANAAFERPLKIQVAGSKNEPGTHDVVLAYGRELSAKFPKLEEGGVYAVFEQKSGKRIVAKLQIEKEEALAIGEQKFSHLSYLALFMPDNYSDAEEVTQKKEAQAIKLRLIVDHPTDPESIKLLRQAERGAIRNDDRVSAAELRWLTGDWRETARHLELAGREFFRKKDRISQLCCEALEGIARTNAAK